MTLDLVINDIKSGDIYEHHRGGFYQVSEVNNKSKEIHGKRLNNGHARSETHSVTDVKNFFGMFR